MKTENITKLGLLTTGVYLFILGVYSTIEWEAMLNMKPNEFGDFLAGSLGPLALGWLVCGYFQQGIELQQNTKALTLQADELKNSTRALEYQVEELKRSVEQQSRIAELTASHLELEVSKNQRLEDQQRALNEPYFEVRATEIYALNAPGLGAIKIINSGASVTIVTLTTNHPNDSLPKIKVWDTGIVHQFIPFRDERPAGKPVAITVRFRQANGVQKDLLITMEAHDGGEFALPILSIE